MRQLLALLACLLLAIPAQAQVLFENTRTVALTQTHTTASTSASLAIPGASVGSNLLGWKICNDPVNTSTYLFVGQAADPSTDGVQLDKGACFECPNCNGALLKKIKVISQAAANGYSVVQYKP